MSQIENDDFEEIDGTIELDEIIEQQKEERRKLEKELREKAGKYVPIITTRDGKVKSVEELTIEEKRDEIMKCAVDPIYFICTYLTIFDQTKGEGGEIVPFKLFDFQKELIRAYLDNRFTVANKYRQAGVSTTTCAYLAWHIAFQKNRSVAIVANKLETAQNELMNDVVEFIENCPSWLVPSPDKKDTQKLKVYNNGSKLGAFSAAKGLRGYTPTLLFWDETAWTEKGDAFWESAGPTMQTGGGAMFVSTPNGLDAVFYKYFDSARRKANNFKAVELWWFNDPRYNKGLEWVKNKNRENEIRLKDEKWSNEKRIKMMDDGWEATSPWFEDQILNANGNMRKIAQELLCSFLGSGDNFVPQEHIKDIEENYVMTPLRQDWVDKNMWIFEEPQDLEFYGMAVDVSSGHGDDYSTINILKAKQVTQEKVIKTHGRNKKVKVRTHQLVQVAEYYGKVTPQELAEIAYTFGRQYNNAYAVVDVTGGYGSQTVEKLFELGYEPEYIHYSDITHKPTRNKLGGYVKQSTKTLADGTQSKIDLVPGFFIGGNRGAVLIEMERSIRMKEMDIKSNRLLAELKTFVTVGGSRVADHKRSYHDDSIMSLAIGIYVLNFELSKFNVSTDHSKKVLDAMLKFNEKDSAGRNRLNTKAVDNMKQNGFNAHGDRANPFGAHAWMMKGLKK
jgi:hypothetical protein